MHVEQVKYGKGSKTRSAIIVTELPYQVNKAALLEKIALMVNDKKIEGIADLRDESDRDGIRVVIELKRDAVAAVVLVRAVLYYLLLTLTYYIHVVQFIHLIALLIDCRRFNHTYSVHRTTSFLVS